MICRNGHQQPPFADKFCIFCGVALDAAANQSTPAQVQNNRQPDQAAANPQMSAQLPNQQLQPTQPQSYPPPPVLQAQHIQQRPPNMLQALQCYTCGGNGQGLNANIIVCKECSWLKPLIPGYQVDSSTFEWAADGKAMSALRSMKTLNAAAKAVSEKVGRRWIESTFNGVLLGEKQLPHIYGQAVRAARILAAL